MRILSTSAVAPLGISVLRRRHSGPLGSRPRRIVAALAVTLTLVALVAFFPQRVHAQSLVGVKYYYLSLGNSLAYGYEPNLDWSHGYAQKWYGNLQSHGARSMTNYGCPGETSNTFINEAV